MKAEMERGAQFSICQRYRYSLWRIWNRELPLLGGVLLNPSTATAEADDPTVSRMIERARRLGFGGVVMVNLFAYRSTEPESLYKFADPIGPENNAYIEEEMKKCGLVLCGWGKHGALKSRGQAVCELLRAAGIKRHALRVNDDGSPEHPLYLPYNLKPAEYEPPAKAARMSGS